MNEFIHLSRISDLSFNLFYFWRQEESKFFWIVTLIIYFIIELVVSTRVSYPIHIHNSLEESPKTLSKTVSLERRETAENEWDKKDRRNIGEQSGSNSIAHPWITINRLHENPVQTLSFCFWGNGEEKISRFRIKEEKKNFAVLME